VPCSADLAASLGLVALTLAVFLRAVSLGFTYWDDNHYVTENPLLLEPLWRSVASAFSEFHICNYHPLTLLSYRAEHALAGLDPWLYHLDNVLLHAAAAVLAYHLGRLWLDDRLAAFLAAALFAVHPLRVESVAWVSERKGLLCAVFSLAALIAYTLALRRSEGAVRTGDDDSARPDVRLLAACALCFVLALLSKVLAVTLPAVLVLFLAARRSWSGPRLRFLAPLFALAALFTWLGVQAQAAYGAVKGLHGGGVGVHLLSVLKGLGFYGEKLVWPLKLSPKYELKPAASLFEAHVVAGAVLAALGVWAACASWRRRRRALLGLGFFAVTWAPVSGLVPSSMPVADRYLYLPALGLFWIACDWLRGRLRSTRRRDVVLGRAGLALLGASIAACCFLSWERVGTWRDTETLWKDALLEDPRNPVAHNQLAAESIRRGRFAEALVHAKESIAGGLEQPEYAFNLALAYRGLGEGEKERACAHAISTAFPAFLPARLVELRHLLVGGNLDAAERLASSLETGFTGDPRLVAARGEVAEAAGRFDEALRLYLRALELRPRDPEVLASLSLVLARLGDGRRALRAAEYALKLGGAALFPESRWKLNEVGRLVE
jgi:tetratricopeptide (TPR) repeat protein